MMILILCGYMGSGKSLIGKKLADKLDWPFVDLDEEIVSQKKMSIPEIFRQEGEIRFRKMEAETLQKLLKSNRNTVLSLGGGTPCYGNNLELIKANDHTRMVYLKVNVDTLTERLLAEKENRPLIKELGTREVLHDYIRKHLFERQNYYFQSDLIIDTSALTPGEVVENIYKDLSKAGDN